MSTAIVVVVLAGCAGAGYRYTSSITTSDGTAVDTSGFRVYTHCQEPRRLRYGGYYSSNQAKADQLYEVDLVFFQNGYVAFQYALMQDFRFLTFYDVLFFHEKGTLNALPAAGHSGETGWGKFCITNDSIQIDYLGIVNYYAGPAFSVRHISGIVASDSTIRITEMKYKYRYDRFGKAEDRVAVYDPPVVFQFVPVDTMPVVSRDNILIRLGK